MFYVFSCKLVVIHDSLIKLLLKIVRVDYRKLYILAHSLKEVKDLVKGLFNVLVFWLVKILKHPGLKSR